MLCDVSNSKDKGMFLCGIEQAINEMPTVDTERHGHWINDRFCSKCGYDYIKESGRKSKYCPNCGAKTEEVTE